MTLYAKNKIALVTGSEERKYARGCDYGREWCILIMYAQISMFHGYNSSEKTSKQN